MVVAVQQRMALVGDSLAAGLAPPLKKLAVEAGWDFTSLANVGKSTRWYGQQNLIADLVARYNPHLAVIVLGTNDEGAETTPAVYLRAIDAVLQQVGRRAKVVWIGTPTIPRSPAEDAGAAARNRILAQRLGSVAVDGRSMTADLSDKRTPDGVHFTAAGSKVWAERIFAKVATLNTRAPFNWKRLVAGLSLAGIALVGVVYWRR